MAMLLVVLRSIILTSSLNSQSHDRCDVVRGDVMALPMVMTMPLYADGDVDGADGDRDDDHAFGDADNACGCNYYDCEHHADDDCAVVDE